MALRRAVTHDPDDLSVYADIAGTLADIGRLDDALDWVDRALAKDPEFDCAVHTAHRLRYRADGELSHLVELADFARDHPDDTHEHTDLADCCAGTPWLSRVPTDPGHRARPAAAAAHGAASPSAAAVERLRRVAEPGWAHPPAAYDAALELVLVEPDDLLALLAHPPTAAGRPRPGAVGALRAGVGVPGAAAPRHRRAVDAVHPPPDRWSSWPWRARTGSPRRRSSPWSPTRGPIRRHGPTWPRWSPGG